MIVIRADINHNIGIGHIKRCITLADSIVKHDCSVCFIVGASGKKYIKYLTNYNVMWLDNDIELNEQMDAERTIDLLQKQRIMKSWIVVDNYKLNYKWERCIGNAGYYVAVIDDYRTRKHCADILISDNDHPFDPALNQIDKSSKVLAGKKYALIGPEYYYADNCSIGNLHLNHLLITYGGSDPTNETVKILNALRIFRDANKKLFNIQRIDVVVGPANRDIDDIIESAHYLDCVVHNAPESLHQLMKDSDLVFTSGGNSLIEALALRKPCVVTSTSDNQQTIISQLVEENAIYLLGSYFELNKNNIAQKLPNILNRYRDMVQNIASRDMYDIYGADRIVKEMIN